jgi:integrase
LFASRKQAKTMGWKATGQPTVRQQRDKWVVRVDGIDTETGARRPRQIGTYPSKRAANAAASSAAASGEITTNKGTLAWLIDRWCASRTDIGVKSRMQYEWAGVHIKAGLGSLTLDKLDRDDISRWLEATAAAGKLSKRSLQICRMVLRAVLADAVEEGLIRRSPAARVVLPKSVARPVPDKGVRSWDEAEIRVFLRTIADHRWAGPLRMTVLYGLRRSELLALRWGGLDLNKGTMRISGGLVEASGKPIWTEGKNERSRRTILLDGDTLRALKTHRALQLHERLAAGSDWVDDDLIISTNTGNRVSPSNFDQTLRRLVAAAGVPRLTSHGLRHTAATHMVRQAADAGELRAVADVLGHSPDMLMKTYAHALPDSIRAVADRIASRAMGSPD